MRLLTYHSETGPRVAGVHENGWIDLQRTDPRIPASLKELLALGAPALDWARAAIARGQALPPNPPALLPPVPDPEKVICVGLNYADHAAESKMAVPTEPVIFNKFPSALAAAGQPIVLPEISRQVDYEAELVVIIGRQGKQVPAEQALTLVAGYACGNDVSARDWQLGKPAGQWLLGKTFDTFAPCGPELVTPDEVGDPGQLDICLRLNGTVMQQSNTRQWIFSLPTLIAYISRVCTLKPGDLIFTGTPPGVGMGRKPPVFLQPGDTVEIEIARVGKLRNPIVAAV